MKRNWFYILLLLIPAGMLVTGCDKDEDTQELHALNMHVHPVAGSTPVSYGPTFQDNTGRSYTLSDFRYYISNIVLIREDGSEFPISGKYLLVSPLVPDYDLGEVPVGSYKGLTFYVGIDSATNHMDPTLYPAGDPLAIQTPGMHWSWNSGYLFVKIEGLVDTTLSNVGVVTNPLVFHIGLDQNYARVDLSNNPFEVNHDGSSELVLVTDLNKFFEGIDLRTENFTHSFDDVQLAAKMVANIPASFSIE